ncbi:hypothetical protein CAFE_32160 [Caprobacter fermentans]|uniref:Uncharacterized protein n=1 Tax=Caproicibacter fermentans TaxID=2576756 RepID=A0A6N8I2V2_9FIRM|nr:hypothetical protein [Caproicibacter fermentans]OCN01497.1 hypothetical protein A7X67_16095 [Clostridium sp. W14A]
MMPAKSLELRHTIHLIRELDEEIKEIEAEIQQIMDDLHSPITTIPGKHIKESNRNDLQIIMIFIFCPFG